MRFFPAALLVGSAVAAPAATLTLPNVAPKVNDVKILGITAIGTGCPAGHAFVNVDATGTIFDVAFDQYTASVGPGNLPADARKNCRISINLAFPQGYQLVSPLFSLSLSLSLFFFSFFFLFFLGSC